MLAGALFPWAALVVGACVLVLGGAFAVGAHWDGRGMAQRARVAYATGIGGAVFGVLVGAATLMLVGT